MRVPAEGLAVSAGMSELWELSPAWPVTRGCGGIAGKSVFVLRLSQCRCSWAGTRVSLYLFLALVNAVGLVPFRG